MASAGVAVTLAGGAAHAGGTEPQDADRAPSRVSHAWTYVVRPGDTLWAIAARLAGPEGDPRPMVDALSSANRLRGVLVPGQRLVVPA